MAQTPVAVQDNEKDNVTPIIKKVKSPDKLNFKLLPFPRKTESQQAFSDLIKENKLLLGALGSAGTGKTSLAIYEGLEKLFNPASDINHIKVVRTLVPVREVGFLKGDINEKQEPFNIYRDMVNTYCNSIIAWATLIQNGFISFTGTTHEQGKTYENTYVVADEVQNYTFKEIDLITTRLGRGSRLVFCGDTSQDYLKKGEKSGLSLYIEIIEKLNVGAVVMYQAKDIVRCDLVRDYICMRNKIIDGDELPNNFETQSDYY